jgi:hypothetical protein
MWLRLKALWKRRQLERDLEDELAFHLAMKDEKNRANGVADDVRRAFGNQALGDDICDSDASAAAFHRGSSPASGSAG